MVTEYGSRITPPENSIGMRMSSRGMEFTPLITISTVVSAVNHDDVVDLGHFLIEHDERHRHIHAWHLYQFLAEGRGGAENREEFEIPESRYREVCDQARVLAPRFRIFRRSNMYRPRVIDFHWRESGRILRGSPARPGR